MAGVRNILGGQEDEGQGSARGEASGRRLDGIARAAAAAEGWIQQQEASGS